MKRAKIRKRSIIKQSLANPMFKARTEKPKRGPGSFKREKRIKHATD